LAKESMWSVTEVTSHTSDNLADNVTGFFSLLLIRYEVVWLD
jgi:hypothetical protein